MGMTLGGNMEFLSRIEEKPWRLGHGVLNPWKINMWSLASMKKIRACSSKSLKYQGMESWIYGID